MSAPPIELTVPGGAIPGTASNTSLTEVNNAEATSSASIWDRTEIDLPELLRRLGFEPGEHVQHFRVIAGGSLVCQVHLMDSLPDENVLAGAGDNYFGMNPVGESFAGGRPGDADVTALRALFLDLDFKPGGCGDVETASAIIEAISGTIGRPVAVTWSGHGLQPFWAVENGELGSLGRGKRRALLRRWGRLARSVAEAVGEGRPVALDSVFDAARLARMPRSTNRKDPAAPVPVFTLGDTGSPIAVRELEEVFEAYGISEVPTDRDLAGEPVSPPASWMYAPVTCQYATTTISGWATDTPKAGRHQWLVAQLTRLAAMHRNGCVTEIDYRRAIVVLEERFRVLRATTEPVKPVAPGEVEDALDWGINHAATKDEDGLAAEVGGHRHLPDLVLPAGQVPTPRQLFSSNRVSCEPTTLAPGAELINLTSPVTQRQQLDHCAAVERRVADLLVDREARRILAAQAAPEVPKVVCLADLLAEPDDPVVYRVDQLMPIGGSVLLAAQYKAGKSTMIGNLIRCLADGGFFLGNFMVSSPPGKVVLIDDELAPRTLRRWLRDQGIAGTDRVDVVPLKGRVAAFNPIDPDNRAIWAERLASARDGVLILDCLRPVLDAHGLSEDKDAGKFLVALDALKAEIGVGEMVLVHHMGHAGERSRGDSRLRDWPDVEWRMVRDGGDAETAEPNAPRFFSAYGRDVDVPEGRLEFDQRARRLSYRAGNRRQEKADQQAADALATIRELLEKPDVKLSGSAIEGLAKGKGHTQKALRNGLKMGREKRLILVEPGQRGADLHYLNPSWRDQ